jgi:hypothetical protein
MRVIHRAVVYTAKVKTTANADARARQLAAELNMANRQLEQR